MHLKATREPSQTWRYNLINKRTTWTEDKKNWIRASHQLKPLINFYSTTPPFPNPLTLSPHRTTHNITHLQQIRLRWACALAQLYGYKILAHSSKKGDVLKMLRFSLFTVAEQTRLGNFEDKLSRVFSFLGQSMYFWYSKEPSRWEGSFERPKHMN